MDRYVPALNRDARRLVKAYAKLLGALAELRVGRSDVLAVREIVCSYVAPVAEFLSLTSEREQSGSSRSYPQSEIDVPQDER